jgi:hypothetical protein
MDLHQASLCSYEALSLTDTVYETRTDTGDTDCDIVWCPVVLTGQTRKGTWIWPLTLPFRSLPIFLLQIILLFHDCG